ncbi:transglutaminase family protein [Nocardia seriolae]|uniref:transglutaminase family protein n=1 Tax=Nocardia seriolae TaxID=37332 RepID=UPI00051A203E|nr:transglutaminase family protein [Nocardia seriolae]MTJ60296.1 transglutaminase family protein [Nocardia seriolae]MTJ75479.1 transglutaminase family protein [Nocardia seriolae]MTJ85286.1 transglutaminase family protein [Nocardia seriolae]MTK29282.1 transglutaminase family protein [Nocardia seriolae]MTK38226.1 transglutaminase family protein [Nocardia seriolae]
MRRLRVLHRTVYVYSDVVTSSYGRAYLTPRGFPGQRLLSHDIRIDPVPSDRSVGTDVYGNTTLYFQVTAEHRRLEVTGESLVEISPPIDSGDEPTWEQARPTTGNGPLAVEFTLDLTPEEITPEVADYAAASFPPGRPLLEAVKELTARIHTDFTYESGSTTVSTSVADVFAERRGVCQDFARLGIACLRSPGLAGRYVSGYLATDPPPGKERMVGADATHAWAAVWHPGDPAANGEPGHWIACDPTNNQFADDRYVTVAWGRDYADVPPLRGIIYTDAKESTITVSVDVAPSPADE